MAGVTVQFLGTGDPFANGGRMQSCILLQFGERRWLLDCGATTLLALARYAIDPATIDGIIVTHLHGDHAGGLPFLLLDASLNAAHGAPRLRRARPLVLAGPAELEAMVRDVTTLFRWTPPLLSSPAPGALEFVSLRPGEPVEVAGLSVTAFRAVHTPEALSFRLTCGDTCIAYSGDTAWNDALPALADGADLFICQAYTFAQDVPGMLSYETLVAHRNELHCKRLVLTHIGGEMQQRLSEVGEEVAEDGLIIKL